MLFWASRTCSPIIHRRHTCFYWSILQISGQLPSKPGYRWIAVAASSGSGYHTWLSPIPSHIYLQITKTLLVITILMQPATSPQAQETDLMNLLSSFLASRPSTSANPTMLSHSCQASKSTSPTAVPNCNWPPHSTIQHTIGASTRQEAAPQSTEPYTMPWSTIRRVSVRPKTNFWTDSTKLEPTVSNSP